MGHWFRQPQPLPAVVPRYGLVLAHVWVQQKRRFQPRVMYADGTWTDLAAPTERQCQLVPVDIVTTSVKAAVGAGIVSCAAHLFPPDVAVPGWEECGVVFPAGASPPVPTAVHVLQATRAMLTRASSKPKATKAKKGGKKQPAVRNSGPPQKQARYTSPTNSVRAMELGSEAASLGSGAASESSREYGDDMGSSDGDEYDREVAARIYEHRDVPLSPVVATVKATGPATQGHRPSRI